ncbi:hypothetical protein [Edaphobacter dinghuensis]|uniref:Uncharacterized protein n=1 Tax=Edaphobacter dinghuensis TaxID=1560005 RepID=A0A917HQ36_9BACT|nr:hypothetical protein [Edaphobacter dinghuensis]GGG87092.1 hypothetical protein GCM10011585_33890 [Edaphobacter dinghuensis]
MQADFSYMTGSNGFTSVFPNTPEAEREYNRIFAETGGVRLAPWEFDTFRQNARAAGYSVRKCKPACMSSEKLASLLEGESKSSKAL